MEAPLSGEVYESPTTLAAIMLGRYAVPFELAGVLLLVAAVAAVVLAKKERGTKGRGDEGTNPSLEGI